MKIAAIQMDIAWNEPGKNVLRARELSASAREGGADLILLPEMFTTGFSMLKGACAVEAEHEGRKFLQAFAAENDCFIAGTLPACSENENLPFNRLSLYDSTGEIAYYDKIHLFRFGGEGESYSSGGRILTHEVKGVRVTFFTCYDLRFSPPFYLTAPQTDLFVVLANWPSARTMHWEALLRARAIETQAYVAGVNRVGAGGNLEYDGATQIVSPKGDTLVHGGAEESIVFSDIDLKGLRNYREAFPCLKDRREDVYSTLGA